MPESQLFRAYGAPAAADRIRNPGHRPTYSYGLARLISKLSLIHISDVYDILREGSKVAEAKAAETLKDVKASMRINYFDDDSLIQ